MCQYKMMLLRSDPGGSCDPLRLNSLNRKCTVKRIMMVFWGEFREKGLNFKQGGDDCNLDQSTPIEQSHVLKCMYDRRHSLTVIGITGYYKVVVTSH